MKLKTLYLVFSVFVTMLLTVQVQAQNVALNFDGSNDFVQTTYSGISGSANRTFEAWIFVSLNAPSSNLAVLDYGLNAVGSRNTFSVGGNRSLQFISGGTNTNIASPANSVPVGQWAHVAFVLDNGTGYLYVNGAQVGTGNLSNVNTPAGNQNLKIGQRVSGGSILFEGSIDEVRIFDYARSGTQITAEMNAEFCTIPSGLVAYYRFNDGTPLATNTNSTTAIDDSGNSNTGTLNNFALTGSTSNWDNGPVITPGATATSTTINSCSAHTSPSGQVFWTSGSYSEVLTGASGCDSISTVDLVINIPTVSNTVVVCDSLISPSGNYIWYNTGIYHDTVISAVGCDSIFTIVLGINSSEITITPTACDSYTSPSGNVITSSGMYVENLTSVEGCDSTINISLTVNSSSSSTLNPTLCQNSYTPPSGTVTWTSSGTYQDIIMNAQGCDSVITINLDLTIDLSVTQDNNILTSNETNANATYQWLDCDNGNTPIAGATDQIFIAPTNGNYAVLIVLNGCTLTSECYEVTTIGLQEKTDAASIELYPNPTTGEFQINLGLNYSQSLIQIIDINGKVVFNSQPFNQETILIDLKLSAGLYSVKVIQQDKIINKRLVIR